ncbi:hypothetical protein GQX74_011968 [Glossina fuscipes]|nr:hypothetical protein GQX74_011968 [Glossina fuscipes]
MSHSSHNIRRPSSFFCPHPSHTVQSRQRQPFCNIVLETISLMDPQDVQIRYYLCHKIPILNHVQNCQLTIFVPTTVIRTLHFQPYFGTDDIIGLKQVAARNVEPLRIVYRGRLLNSACETFSNMYRLKRLDLANAPSVPRDSNRVATSDKLLKVNGIQNFRVARFDTSRFHLGRREDGMAAAQPHLLVWKPIMSVTPPVYPNIKPSYNRYIPVAPVQSYMLSLAPPKVNSYPYKIKEYNDMRKSTNLRQLALINAILPKSYIPPHANVIRNHRHNKLLYPQYYSAYGRQMVDDVNAVHLIPRQQYHQYVPTNTAPPLAISKPTEIFNLNIHGLETNTYGNSNTTIDMLCGRKMKDQTDGGSNNNVLYYYCQPNINGINYTQILPKIPTSTATTTTTLSAMPKAFLKDTYEYTTGKPSLHTAIPAREELNLKKTYRPPTTTSTPFKSKETNGMTDDLLYASKPSVEIAFLPIMSPYGNKEYQGRNYFFTTPSTVFHSNEQRHTPGPAYEIINNNGVNYLTTVHSPYGNKEHSFFTIEDAVTSSPANQVFNDPYLAYKHARKQHERWRSTLAPPPQPTTTALLLSYSPHKSDEVKSFFDSDYDIDHEYELFDHPTKTEYSNFALHEPLGNSYNYIDQAQPPKDYKSEETSSIGRLNSVTTYRPTYDSITERMLTTPKSSTSSPSKANITTEVYAAWQTTTTATTTAKAALSTTRNKFKKMILKSPASLRPFKYHKQRGLRESSTTTSTTSPTRTTVDTSKYTRQPYKYIKKLKKVKHLFSTSSTTTVDPTTTTSVATAALTTVTTTEKVETNRTESQPDSEHLAPTNTTSSSEKPRISQRIQRGSMKANVSTAASNSVQDAKTAHKRGSKRTNERHSSSHKKEKRVDVQNSRQGPKSRRRSSTTTSPITLFEPHSTPILPITTTKSTATATTAPTTTMRSIMKIAKSRNKMRSDKTSSRTERTETDILELMLSSTEPPVPPLPIEIYFRQSQKAYRFLNM